MNPEDLAEKKVKKSYLFAVDFDGTIVTHDYPNIGTAINGAISVLQELADNGHKIILYTMRSNKELEDAIKYCKDSKIEIFSVNENPTQKTWTKSPKIYAHYYIDDASVGCPLIYGRHQRPFCNWESIRELLCLCGVLNSKESL